MEYFAEWALSPFNVVFQRVQTGVFDPLQIGDKHKWFRNGLQKIDFPVYDVTSSTLGAAVQAHLEQKDAGTAEDPTGRCKNIYMRCYTGKDKNIYMR